MLWAIDGFRKRRVEGFRERKIQLTLFGKVVEKSVHFDGFTRSRLKRSFGCEVIKDVTASVITLDFYQRSKE